jgi:hypothetical protein
MSKEHKNKRDAKKKPAMSPVAQREKSGKTRQKGHKEYPGELNRYYSSLPNKAHLHCLMLHLEIDRDRRLLF